MELRRILSGQRPDRRLSWSLPRLLVCLCLIWGLGLLFGTPRSWGGDPFTLDFRYAGKTMVDSSRKDFVARRWDPLTLAEIRQDRTSDDTFVAYLTDLTCTLHGDFSSGQFLDIAETLHYRTFRPEDIRTFANTSGKFSLLDHLLNVTYAFSVGDVDVIRLDYLHNLYRLPSDSIWNYLAHKGKARYLHQINPNAGLEMAGSYEEREFSNQRQLNYQEAALTLEYSSFFPEQTSYKQISSSLRGDRHTFEQTPNGMSTRNAVDYYTTWSKKPDQEDADAKYLRRILRGDLYLSLRGDYRVRRLTQADNTYAQPSALLGLTYDMSEQLRITLEDIYYRRKYDRESPFDFYFDHDSNKVSLCTRHESQSRYIYQFTFSNEWFRHRTGNNQDYKINTGLLESFYHFGRSAASLALRASVTRYGQPRLFFPDLDEYQAVFAYDYPMTPSFLFHLKNEWTDRNYDDFADDLYSSHVRNIWRVSAEKTLSPSQSLEVGYQSHRERHRVFTANNLTDKSLFFSWNSVY